MSNATHETCQVQSSDALKVITLDDMPIHGRRWVYFEDLRLLAISRRMDGAELLTALAEAGAR
ncbi:MAG: hypothetical protein JWO98_2239 [Frankiales bacterium]|nr:hypothetical protein [Frankiales bacterium]